jgi:4-hydroxy-3-methylbut-2-enyl diphosphate reductase
MLMSESLEVEKRLKAVMIERYGDANLGAHFQAFDTICSATQDRQDAVVALLGEKPLDLVVVIGGYNSSNTCNLARICADSRPTFHIADPDCLISASEIRHRPVGSKTEAVANGWFPSAGEVVVGVTSGASTPDNLVADAIQRLTAFAV